MSSSTSSSDRKRDEGRRWRAFAWSFAITASATLLAAVLALLALDPYDTGRHGFIPRVGPNEGGAWRANVSRAADPSFNAAIVGNSLAQMIEPWTLDERTGLRFVNLSVAGAAPPEKQLVARTFYRNHPEPAALVMTLDSWWCLPRQTPRPAFPAWLYADSPRDYFSGLLRWQSLEMLPRRMARLRGVAPAARADGYDDYTPYYAALKGGEKVQRRMASGVGPWESENPENRFPATEILADILARTPEKTPVVLVWTPVHVSHQPRPGSPAAQTAALCRQALAGVAASHGRVEIIDWGGDTPRNRDPRNFHDGTHYVKAVAHELSGAVAAALARLLGVSSS